MEKSKMDINIVETPEQKEKTITVKHKGKDYIFSHTNSPILSILKFAYLKELETDNIISVAWNNLEESVREEITNHLLRKNKLPKNNN